MFGLYTQSYALRYGLPCCITDAAACMISRTVCDRFKHRPQRYRTNGKRENRRKKTAIKEAHSSGWAFFARFSSHYSSSLPFSLFSLRTVWCVFATRTGWPICALSFSLFLLILLKETENDEQTVRCEGCIIVRIIRAAKKTGYQCQMIGSIVTAMAVLNSRIVPAPCSLLLLFVFLSLLPAFVTLVRSAHYCALRRRRQQL
jgi:hypothetical protein